MSGHNKWSQIRHKKGASDVKRGKIFSKILRAISIAAKSEANPPAPAGRRQKRASPGAGGSPSSTGRQFSPRLRSAIETAKEYLVPLGNIERAISKASDQKDLSEMVIEAYGPEGIAIIIEAVTDNTNRTIAEVKKILSDHEAKIANPGSVLWAFDAPIPGNAKASEWKAKFPQSISEESKTKLEKLIEALDEHDDVQHITTNTVLS